MNISGKFTCKVTVHEAPPQICHCTVEATREQNQDAGDNQILDNQILDNQIYGPQPKPSAVKEETMEERNSPTFQIQSVIIRSILLTNHHQLCCQVSVTDAFLLS